MKNQQVPTTHTKGAVTQNIMQTNPTTDLNWLIPNQQTLCYEWRFNQDSNVTVELIRQTAFKQAWFRTQHFQQTQSLQNPANWYGQQVVQSTHLCYGQQVVQSTHLVNQESLHKSLEKYSNLSCITVH